uniref:Mitogen-activated protein kinase n=1 Tax=Rhodotorula toruloides TaxID=5286 RepID=A0A0K3C5Y7_RHOTO
MSTVPQRPAPAAPAPSSGPPTPDPYSRPDSHSTAAHSNARSSSTVWQGQKAQGANQMPMEDVAAALPAVPAPAASVAQQPPAPDPKPKEKEKRKIRFSVGTEYKVEEIIGEGAYGVVCSATHVRTGVRVAIKKVSPFDHSMFALRTLREVKLLRYFAENQVSENLITIVDVIKPSSYDSFKEVYLIQELMETDLYRVIKTQQLSDDQTLRALKALHSANVIHRDLKPSNLLLNANCDLKICDFGLARSVDTAEPSGGEAGGFMTEYVATRWYRAPEIMLSFKQYSKAIDIWSVGCICAEMLSGRPLFPGRDYHHQLTLILSVTGTPMMDEFCRITSRRSRDYLRALPFQRKRPFAELFPNASPLALDFLAATLTFDPTKRITAEQALEHPYLAAYHDPTDEPTAPPLDPGFFDFDLDKPSREEIRKLLYNEVMTFKRII